MRDPVTIRALRDCVTPYGPLAAGEELRISGHRVPALGDAVELVGGDASERKTAALGTAETADVKPGQPRPRGKAR